MAAAVALLAACLATTTTAKQLEFHNGLGKTLWVASRGEAGHAHVYAGGWIMPPNATVRVVVADNWAGRFWGRTGCKFAPTGEEKCETGGCGRLQCRGSSGAPPATLAEFTFTGRAGPDYYHVSLVDGFNIRLTISPMNSVCSAASCNADVTSSSLCPAELKARAADGRAVGCNSACSVFGTDRFCCRGLYSSTSACRSRYWPRDYPALLKIACPRAYSYVNDESYPTVTCWDTGYRVQFG